MGNEASGGGVQQNRFHNDVDKMAEMAFDNSRNMSSQEYVNQVKEAADTIAFF